MPVRLYGFRRLGMGRGGVEKTMVCGMYLSKKSRVVGLGLWR